MEMGCKMASHKDVEYVVKVAGTLEEKSFRSFDSACAHAIKLSLAYGSVYIDIRVYSTAGAVAAGLREAYRLDPDASATERIEVNVTSWGIVV
mgnify:FL=1